MFKKGKIISLFIINGYSKDGNDVSSTIRSVYGKCEFDCAFIQAGHGVTGIVEINEQ